MSEKNEITKDNCQTALDLLKELGRSRMIGHTVVLMNKHQPLVIDEGYVEVYFYGPQSIALFLKECASACNK